MKRFRPTILVVSGLLALTACGSTIEVTGSRAVAGNGGLDAPGVTGEGRAPDVPGAAVGGPSDSGGSVAQPGVVQPGALGSSPGGALGPSGGTQVVAPGVTSKQPLQIGVLVTDTDSFQAAAGFPSFTKLRRDSVHAYIKAINAAGGVAGRKLTVIDATMNYSAASYDNEFEAACQTFTRDNHVGAVIYDGITYNATFNTCLTKAGVPAFYMHQVGMQVGDSTDLANYPGLITAGSVSVDRRLKALLNGALAQRFLHAGSKLGILVETCPFNTRAYDRTLAPIVTRNKIAVSRVDIACGAGAADHTNGIGGAQAAVLRFQTEGVDSVMFVSNYENGVWYYFATAAESQHYRPQYLLWHNQGCPACIAAGESSGLGPQIKNMRGFGSSPLWEVTYPPTPPPAQAAVRKACLATAKRQSIATPGLNEQAIVLDSCDVVNLLRRALTLSGGQGGIRALASAVEALGTDFVSTMILNGATRFGPGRHDGTALGAVSIWQDKCECIAYITSPRAIP